MEIKNPQVNNDLRAFEIHDWSEWADLDRLPIATHTPKRYYPILTILLFIIPSANILYILQMITQFKMFSRITYKYKNG